MPVAARAGNYSLAAHYIPHLDETIPYRLSLPQLKNPLGDGRFCGRLLRGNGGCPPGPAARPGLPGGRRAKSKICYRERT